MLLLTLLACNGDDSSATHSGTTSAPTATWEAAFDTSTAGSLSGVWGSGPDDVYVVGGDEDRGEIWHYDGSGWSMTEMPSVGLLVWVFGFGPDDVYSVGVGGGAVHWDGNAWEVLTTDTTTDLWGIWGASPTDLWVVGGDPNAGDPLILHYDGATFTPVPLPSEENDRGAHSLFKVFGLGGEVWAVGQYGLIVSNDGSGFVQQPTGPVAAEDFVSLWGTGTGDLIAVGGRSAGLLSTYDGAGGWDTVRPERVQGLNAVTFLEPDHAVIGGVGGWVGTVTPSTGEVVREEPYDSRDIHALWTDGQGRTYGVGGTFYPPHLGTAVVRTGP